MKRLCTWLWLLAGAQAAWGAPDDCQPLDVYMRSAKIYMGLGQAAQKIPDFHAAEKQLQQALACYPDAIDPRYLLAIIHWRKRSFDKFLVFARELDALDVEGRHTDTVWQMRRAAWGELFNRGVDSLKASNRLDSLRSLAQAEGNSARYDSLTNQGRRHLESARRLFLFSLEMDSSRSEPYQNLGVIDVRLQNWEDALVWYRRSLLTKPADPDLTRNMISMNLRLERLDSAMHYVRALLDTSPLDLEALTHQAGLYARMGFPDSANLVFEQIITRDPNNKPVLFNLGMTRVQSAQLFMEEKKRFVEQANDYAEDYNRMVGQKAPQSKLDVARQKQQDALASLKEASLHAQEAWGQASDLFERLATLDTLDYEAYYYWGLSQFWLERFDRARVPLERSVALNRDYCPPWQILGYTYSRLGEADKAARAKAAFESCGS